LRWNQGDVSGTPAVHPGADRLGASPLAPVIPGVGPGITAATYLRITEGMPEAEAVLGCPAGNNCGKATPDLGRFTMLIRSVAEINLGPPRARWKGRHGRSRPPNLGSLVCG
jgi:hypothetical protein